MFHTARLKLTILYSFIFLVLFWSLSFGIYFWMNKYFGDTGIDKYIHIQNEQFFRGNREERHEPPSDMILDELRDTIIIIDVLLLFIVPSLAWVLTGKTLKPVQQSYEREKRFLADASHDLRTPLSILSGELELALKKDTTKEEYKKIIKSNKEEVNGLIALVENMLFLSREDVEYKTSQREQVDLTDILIERVVIFQKAAKQKGILLQFKLPKQSIIINGNAQLLKRLFTNLLDNAMKYTSAKGKISITLTLRKDKAMIKIIDSGVGIPQEYQEKIFERFFQVDISRSQKGYGLGLSIAKQIVAFHQGDIHLTSKIGNGTSITVAFPLSKQTPGKSQS
jgi:two-component system sensor histidine kinase CiaH